MAIGDAAFTSTAVSVTVDSTSATTSGAARFPLITTVRVTGAKPMKRMRTAYVPSGRLCTTKCPNASVCVTATTLPLRLTPISADPIGACDALSVTTPRRSALDAAAAMCCNGSRESMAIAPALAHPRSRCFTGIPSRADVYERAP